MRRTLRLSRNPSRNVPARGWLRRALVASLSLSMPCWLAACEGGGGGEPERAAEEAPGAEPGAAQPAPTANGAAAGAAGTSVEQDLQNDFIAVDSAARKVTYAVIAGYNATNGAWNFNGYANGDMRMVVPVGWTVELRFQNQDANVPHSAGIIAAEPGSLPASAADAKLPFPRAHTLEFADGLGAGRTDHFSFTVDQAGDFLLFCGVAGHGRSGMWDHFEVSSSATTATIQFPG